MMNVKIPKDKHISRWVDQENLESKIVKNIKKVIDRGKRSKTLNEVTPVEKISKNLQRSPVQKKLLPSHRLQDDAYE